MSSLLRNFLYNFSYQALLFIIPLITIPYISRVLGPENIGVHSYTLSIATYFLLIAMLGLKNYGNRTIARSQGNKEQLSKDFWGIYVLQISTSLIMTLLYLFYIFYINQSYFLISAIQILIVLSAAVDISWFFFGIEKFKTAAIRGMGIRILGTICVFIFIKESSDLWLYVLIMGISTFMSHLALWPSLFKHISLVRISKANVLPHIKPTIILFIPVMAVSLYNIMDKIMLGSISTMAQLGFYENAERIITIPFTLIAALGTVMIPRMSNLVAKGHIEKNKRYLDITMKYVIIMSSGMAFGIAAIAPIFTPVFFGNQFIPVSFLIQLMSVVIIIKAWANIIRTQYLIPSLRDKDYIFSVMIGAIVNLIANFILIKPLGALGAVIGTIVAELSVSIYQTLVVRKELDIKRYLSNGWPFIIVGFLMFIIVRGVSSYLSVNVISVFIQVGIGFIIYSMFCLIILYFSKDKLFIRIMKKIL